MCQRELRLEVSSDNGQADFVRNGTAKGIMSMSKENTTQLWNSVQDSKEAPFLYPKIPNAALQHSLTKQMTTMHSIR